MRNSTYQSDVIVIGAGPAGLLASLWLTKYNINHLLVDAQQFPRDKTCADVITSNVIRSLNEIDLSIISEMSNQGILTPIFGTNLFSSAKKKLRLPFNDLDNQKNVPSCYSVKRELFDDFLMKIVEKSPFVKVITNCHVQETKFENQQYVLKAKTNEVFYAKLLIVGTGSNSTLSSSLANIQKEDKHFAVGIRAYYKNVVCEDNFCELFLEKNLMPGGLYIAPMSEGMYNVNLVMRKDVMKKNKINLEKKFYELLQTHPLLKAKFKNAVQLDSFKGGSLLLGTKERTICGDSFMLIGDAAGLIDLISANGIPQAMISGKLAALQAIECIQQNDFSAVFMKKYQDKLYQKIKNDLSLGKTLSPLLSHSFVNHFLLSSLNFIGSKSDSTKNSSLVNLLYEENPVKTLFSFSFYKSLLKERKNKRQ